MTVETELEVNAKFKSAYKLYYRIEFLDKKSVMQNIYKLKQ